MDKIRAFLIHLAISLIVVAALCGLIFFVWYPGAFFEVRGTWNALKILISVDLVVGPLLTLVVYKAGKSSLKFDMSVIAAIQLLALVYGSWVLYQERPYYMIFAVDRFELIGRHEVDTSGAVFDSLPVKPLVGPAQAIALRPDNPEDLQQLMNEVLFEAKPDIERRPNLWHAYAEAKEHVAERLVDLAKLTGQGPDAAATVEAYLQSTNRNAAELGYIPLIGRERNFAVILDRETVDPLAILDLEPWPQS